MVFCIGQQFVDVPQLVKLSAASITALAAAGGAWVAYRGVDTWRRQLVATNHYDLAKRLLTAAFQLEHLIERIRLPLAIGYVDMWDRLDKQRAELYVLFLEARAVWGNALVTPEKMLASKLFKLSRCDFWQSQAERPGVPEKQKERILSERVENIRWINDPETDDFGRDVHTAIENIETFLRPFLEVKSIS